MAEQHTPQQLALWERADGIRVGEDSEDSSTQGAATQPATEGGSGPGAEGALAAFSGPAPGSDLGPVRVPLTGVDPATAQEHDSALSGPEGQGQGTRSTGSVDQGLADAGRVEEQGLQDSALWPAVRGPEPGSWDDNTRVMSPNSSFVGG